MRRLQKTNEKNVSYWILSLQAKDIYETQDEKFPDGYCITDKKGGISTKKFSMKADNSLDLMEIQKVYENHYKRRGFGKEYNGRYYTTAIINVDFSLSYKLYNRATKDIFLKSGYLLKDIEPFDSFIVKDGEYIAIKTGKFKEKPILALPAGFFVQGDEIMVSTESIKKLKTIKELRESLYRDGFICDGKKYVRYKRSTGSSREGHCLFIMENLYDDMMKWTKCGLNISDSEARCLSEWEAYTALTLSSIEKTIELNPQNILVIKDEESVFKDKLVAVEQGERGELISEIAEREVKNTIWDGEGLLDESVFSKSDYKNKGMMLLRNRFFKTCAFNTNLQQFFKDNNITEVSQLNGDTKATKIEDILLVVTPSSIKYLKFGTLEDWRNNVDKFFGVVKTEKPTHFFDGRMVQTNYQMLNTLELKQEQVDQLMEPSCKYVEKLRNDHEVMKYHIRYKDKSFYDDDEVDYMDDIIWKLLDINEDFRKTKLYKDFRAKLVKSIKKRMSFGKILVKGTNATLFGNGYEMLCATIKPFDKVTPCLKKGEVMSRYFKDGDEIVGVRSPHITMGNLFLGKNVIKDDILKYFNLSDEIIYVNAIGENFQQRLNGCDYDSDSMLCTNEEMIVSAVKKNYEKFYVPTSYVKTIKKVEEYNYKNLADLDGTIYNGKVGEIVNLSQYLNSILWNNIADGGEYIDLYKDICKLAVLSGLEIDKAKRDTTVHTTSELIELKYRHAIIDMKRGEIKPKFFSLIDREDPDKIKDYTLFNTTMDYVYSYVEKMKIRCSRSETLKILDIFHKPLDISLRSGNATTNKNRVLKIVERADNDVTALFQKMDKATKSEKGLLYKQISDRQQDCLDEIKDSLKNPWAMYYALKTLDDEKCHYRLMLLFALFNERNKTFCELIDSSRDESHELIECNEDDMDFFLYDIPFKKVASGKVSAE